jgi:predicted Zn-dependent protease with MMP-like domain
MSAESRLRALRGLPQRYRTDRRTFDRLVSEVLAEVLAEIDRQVGHRPSNVAVGVEDWPPDDDLGRSESPEDNDLLGLYQGVNVGARSSGYHLTLPDRITLYRGPILAACRSEAETRREIRLTLLHEIGHYVGLGDDELP